MGNIYTYIYKVLIRHFASVSQTWKENTPCTAALVISDTNHFVI